MLKGIIDAGKEIEKLEKKMSQLKAQYEKLIKDTQLEGYEEKVPEGVRIANAQKYEKIEKEVERLTDAIAVLKTVKS